MEQFRQWLQMLAFLLLIAACSRDEGSSDVANDVAPLPTAATLGEQVVKSNADWLASAEWSGTDNAWGERLSMQCRACHGLGSGSGNMLGPSLYGMFGSAAGRAAGFQYSESLHNAEFVWTPRALNAWLAQPAAFLPGNRMAFAGMSNTDDRRALIAYLLAATDKAGTE